ncbi:MAG: hypothetical protein PWP31_885 [Clostridia bacterium]|nr:hypothetical protein [Clostridia bacterium]
MVLNWIKKKASTIVGDKDKNKSAKGAHKGTGIITFNNVEEAMKAEKILKKDGCYCKLVAPPPHLRKGCDLALEIELVEQPVIDRLLTDKVEYNGIHPLTGMKELLEVVKVTYYEKHTMVKSANMKLVFDNESGIIVNISGGGCPDIPYLYTKLVGCNVMDAPEPRDLGYTLCALMLSRAQEECLSLWKEGRFK